MNYKMIGFVIGRILMTEAVLLLVPLMTAVVCGEAIKPFLLPILLLVAVGLGIGWRKPKTTALYARDGFAVVALAWIAMALFGALPFVISGDIPNYVDALFETVSGLTTTGATVLINVETMAKSCLMWRSFTHWIGGMGVLVFVMAILPMTDGHGMHLMRAETPGPTSGKLVSRLSDTAKILYGIYLFMTLLQIILLLAGGMPFFDACIHSFGTAGTGGFSSRNLSVGAYDSVYFDIVIGTFMLLFGINFNLYYFLIMKRFRDVLHSEELRTYLTIVGVAVIAIAINVMHLYENFAESLRHAFFQVSTIITTTGYATTDFNLWPTFSKGILVTLMFIGACAGSTGGGIKVARIVILVKACLADMRKMLHPNAVTPVRYEGKALTDRNVRSVYQYIAVYLLVFVVSFLLLSLEGFDLISTFTALVACINNIGPGLELVGPMGNYAGFSAFSKILLSFDMLIGRLEIFPMLLLFSPSIWKRKHSSSSRMGGEF